MKARPVKLFLFLTILALASSAPGAVAQGPNPSFYQGEGRVGVLTPQQQARNVQLVGQIGGPTRAVAVAGHYAYVGVGSRLVILDISDPAHPAVAGRSDLLPDRVQGVAVAGSYVYVAARYSGLRIINVADPAAPWEAGFYDTPGSAQSVAVAGSYAYVADWYYGLRIINVADPAAPIEAGSYDTPGSAAGVAVADSYAYVADYASGLRIINIADPAAPTQVGFYDTPG